MMLSHAQRLCVEFDVAVLTVSHVSVNPIQQQFRRPYGGAILGYEAKFSFELTGEKANKEGKSSAVNPEDADEDARRIWLARHPAAEEFSRFGYAKIDDGGFH